MQRRIDRSHKFGRPSAPVVIARTGNTQNKAVAAAPWAADEHFQTWAMHLMETAELEKAANRLRFTRNDWLCAMASSELTESHAKLAMAIASLVTRYVFAPVGADELQPFIEERIGQNREAALRKIAMFAMPKQMVGSELAEFLLVALFRDYHNQTDHVEQIALLIDAGDPSADKARAQALAEAGCAVFRFREHEILEDALDCARQVDRYVCSREARFARTFNIATNYNALS